MTISVINNIFGKSIIMYLNNYIPNREKNSLSFNFLI